MRERGSATGAPKGAARRAEREEREPILPLFTAPPAGQAPAPFPPLAPLGAAPSPLYALRPTIFFSGA